MFIIFVLCFNLEIPSTESSRVVLPNDLPFLFKWCINKIEKLYLLYNSLNLGNTF